MPSRLSYPTLLVLGFLAVMACNSSAPEGMSGPEVLDGRLELTLFSATPEIMTPIGLAIDDQDRLFVLESHTHTPPSDYAGPEGDRIKIFTDTDADGTPDDISIFADGIEDGMNLAFSPEGELYLVTKGAVWVFHDEDGDGVSESRDRVLHMVEPENVYDHAGLLGITFSGDGWMYISRGNTGGLAWYMVGTDGSRVEGYGDGGNVMRSRPDGSELEEVATGFWNPFGIIVYKDGRVLVTDNDPDSRGPNRLVDIVQGGDYGYQSLYGGSGIHPYLAWNGELPGTLPYITGIGEAPSGFVDAGLAALPADYQDHVLVTIWEESRIVKIPLSPKGVSLTGSPEVIIEGDQEFRPVVMAADSRGVIYMTDWVIRKYPNHGQGRIWRLKAKDNVEVVEPYDYFAPPDQDDGVDTLTEIYAADTPDQFDQLRTALTSDDPFIRHAATVALARPAFREQIIAAADDANADVRLGAMLALRRAGLDNPEPIVRRFLSDSDVRIQEAALRWIGQASMTSLLPDVEQFLSTGDLSADLFETCLATIRHLQPTFVEGYRAKSAQYARQLERKLPPQFIEDLFTDASKPAGVRARALLYLEQPEAHLALLSDLAKTGGHPTLQIEAVRTLAGINQPDAAAALMQIIQDGNQSEALRMEALTALARQSVDAAAEVVALLDDPSERIRISAARYLRGNSIDADIRQALTERYEALKADPASVLAEQLAFIVAPADVGSARPPSTDAWQAALAEGGDALNGRQVFFSFYAQCSQCHAFNKRGGEFGPDLSRVGQSKSRQQLITAILDPSAEIAPEWQGWTVTTSDGVVHYGRQIDVGTNNVELQNMSGEFITYDDATAHGMAEASLMPEGLETQLTVSDMRDLIAFLVEGEEK